MGKIIKAEKRGGGIESKVIEEYTPLPTEPASMFGFYPILNLYLHVLFSKACWVTDVFSQHFLFLKLIGLLIFLYQGLDYL